MNESSCAEEIAMLDGDRLTEAWLRAVGFRWSQDDRQPSKHWVLWIGGACVDASEKDVGKFQSSESLGIEVAKDNRCDWWYCWVRSDFASRYGRFLHVRHIDKVSELVAMIEGLTGREWEPNDVLYGSFHRPDYAAYLRKEAERLDMRIAKQRDEMIARQKGDDLAKRGAVLP